jgi:ketosteroid isomerase-like protein
MKSPTVLSVLSILSLAAAPPLLVTACASSGAAARSSPAVASATTATAGARADAPVTTMADAADAADAVSALVAADRAHAAASAESQTLGFPSALADDAVFLYPGRPIARGRDAVAALLRSLPEERGRTMTWRPVLADISADGTRGYTVGYGERTGMTESSGSPWIKYISFWRKGDDGRWRVAAWVLTGGAPGAPDSAPSACRARVGVPTVRTAAAVASRANDASAAVVDARDAVRRADSTFAALSARAGAEEAFGTWVADSGASVGGPEPGLTCGREAVRRAFAGSAPGDLVWEPRVADAAASGDLGFTVGVATIRGQPTSHYSKYLTVWKKQPGGEWRFVADGGNPMPKE